MTIGGEGGTKYNFSLNEIYVAISKSNTITEVANFLGIANSTATMYLKKYKFYDYMKDKKNIVFFKKKYFMNI